MSKQSWAILVPIPDLEIACDAGRELRIERVTFVSGAKLLRTWKRFGIHQPLSKYRFPQGPFDDWPSLTSASTTFAHIRTAKSPKDDLAREYQQIDDAIYLLASSAFYRGIRKYHPPFGRQRLIGRRFMFEKEEGNWWATKAMINSPVPYQIDKRWHHAVSKHFFLPLRRILNGCIAIDSTWRRSLRKAAILSGKSLFAPRMADAFLCNMIALEVLLTSRGDKFPDRIIDHMVALFGWMTDERPETWHALIERLYGLRCQIVHDGHANDLRAIDLCNSEMLLANLLRALCTLTRVLHSKSDLLQLAERVRARGILGMKPVERPKCIEFVRLYKSPTHLAELEQNDWCRY